jgi:hypothetical protein
MEVMSTLAPLFESSTVNRLRLHWRRLCRKGQRKWSLFQGVDGFFCVLVFDQLLLETA